MGEVYIVTVGFLVCIKWIFHIEESYQRFKVSPIILIKNSWEMAAILHASMTNFSFFSNTLQNVHFI